MRLDACFFVDHDDRIEYKPEKEMVNSYIATLRLGGLSVIFRKEDTDKLRKAITEAYQHLCAESGEAYIPMPQA